MMETREQTRRGLLEDCEKLPALELSIMRLCALIDEPTNKSTLFKILNKSRLDPETRFKSGMDIELPLLNLVGDKLLDETYRVPDDIKEIIVRKTLEAGLISPAAKLLAAIDSPESWTKNDTGIKICVSCGKAPGEKAFASPLGPLCSECVVSELRMVATREEILFWDEEAIIAALSPEAGMRKRLTAIWNLPRWHPHAYSPNKNTVLTLLAGNMGFAQPHPLAVAVRRAALRACTLSGLAILPILLTINRRERWQLNTNVIMALGNIAPDNPEVRVILQETATDPHPETRRNLIFVLNKLSSPWALEIIRKMSRDRDPDIRTLANNSLDAASKKNTRGHSFSPARIEDDNTDDNSSIRFGFTIKAIREELPSIDTSYSSIDSKCRRVMRDLRIAIYCQDVALFNECSRKLSQLCADPYAYENTLLQIYNNPFDERWFSTLPESIRIFALVTIFFSSVLKLKPDTDALDYALKDHGFKTVSPKHRDRLLYYLAIRLILGGRSSDARSIITEIETPPYYGGLLGMILFIEGKTEKALESFAADSYALRRVLGKSSGKFIGIEVLFYILALLGSHDGANLKKAEELLTGYLAIKDDTAFRKSALGSLQGILHLLNFEEVRARKAIAMEADIRLPLASLLNAFASFRAEGLLSPDRAERISTIYAQAREAGMDWVAMESAALLIRAGRSAPGQREFIDQVVKLTGMRPFVETIEVEEPWKKNLQALMQIGTAPATSLSQKDEAKTRLIWLVSHFNDQVNLHPLEQKMTAKGAWSKGRAVAVSRLFSRTQLDYATGQDIAICTAVRREQYYYRENFYFDNDALLPALIGHPRLFLEHSPSTQVEFVKGEPEIMVVRAESMLHIKPVLKFPETNFMLIEETPTRFRVVKLTEEHRRIARIIGDDGLKVPESASQDVLAAIAALSSFAMVHSDIGGDTGDVEVVKSDPTPHVHLLPAGCGFRVEVFVMPFNEKGTPILKPGAGAANIIAEINSKRMQAQRDLQSEERMANIIEEFSPTFARLSDTERTAQIDDPEECLQILLDLKTLQEQNGVVVEWPEGEKLKVTRELSAKNLQVRIGSGNDWFEVSGSLRVDENLTLDMKRLLELLQSTGKRFIPLEDGTFLALTGEFRKRLDEFDLYTEKKGKELRLHPLAALAMQDMADELPNLTVDAGWTARLDLIRAGQEATPSVPTTLQAELRDYQEEGYRWLARLSEMGIGACLADDMGLGKTIQTLTLLLQRASRGPSLVVAPTSVCWNWSAEADRFAPTLNVIQFTGNNREELVRGLKHNDLLVASYGLLVQEEELLASVDWNVVVLDEAQAIKNVMTKRFQAAVKLKGSFRLATTGTPIQNHLDELWALFSFINPGLLGMQQKFNARFAIPIEKYNSREARTRLKKLIQPFILRRLKSQVLDELPPRTEIVLQVEMSPEEAAFYEALRRQALEKIEADQAPIYMKQLKILAEITRLRQAACNPRLILPDTALPSSKLALFGEVVEELLENRHKALVFSQFVRHLALLREYLDAKKISYRYLDGSTPPQERRKEVDAFQAGEGDLFLISLKAGGLGLNLTAADYVIHMDPWWNPSVEDQASDRAHRIGQQRPVTIYRLVAKDTIEEKIVKLHQEKRDLAGSLLDGADISGKISAEELIRLIREG